MSRKLIELMRVFTRPSPIVSSRVASGSVEEVDDLKSELEDLKRENEDLMSAYEITQHELDNIKDSARDMEMEGEKKAVINFFKTMNSSIQGNLLDTIGQTEKHIRVLKSEGWEPAPEVESLSTTIRLLFNFLKKYGLSPLEELGKIMEVNLRQSELYEYAGSEFKDENELKKVQVKAPGWAFGRDIIARPKIQEYFDS